MFPVIFFLLDDQGLTQVLANILQVKERGATCIVITNMKNVNEHIDAKEKIDFLITVAQEKSDFAALLCVPPLLSICYYTALVKGLNPDENVVDAINF